jgi:3-hydroxyacyl-[acyl-carrier-protein] dehydratase
VASEPLFDISDMDLSAVACSYEDLGRLNPQSGDMRLVDHIIWASDDGCDALGIKQFREDEFWVPGHIPGRPLLPGVLMIEACAQLCSFLYRSRAGDVPGFLGFSRCDDVVFRGQVPPGSTMYVLGREIDFRKRRFIAHGQCMVEGKIVCEAKITGILM